MKFSFEPNNVIKTVKRTVTVMIGGLAIAIAAVASPVTPNLTDLSIPDPLEKVIATAPISDRLPGLNVEQMSALGRRTGMLETSLRNNGQSTMDEAAYGIWNQILPLAAAVPFEKAYVQYDEDGESFFFVYYFKSGQRLEATTYVDEDDDVYFSVVSNNDLLLQNVLPREEFFKRARDIWGGFEENHV